MPSNLWFLQGNLHMQPRLPDNRYFKITKSWPPSPSSCSSPWSPPPSPPSTQSRPSWLDHDDHHNCQLPHDHHRRHAQAQRSGCAKQQGSGQTRSPTARKKVPFFNIVTIYICRSFGSYWLKLQPDTSIGGTSWIFLQKFLFILIIIIATVFITFIEMMTRWPDLPTSPIYDEVTLRRRATTILRSDSNAGKTEKLFENYFKTHQLQIWDQRWEQGRRGREESGSGGTFLSLNYCPRTRHIQHLNPNICI